MINSICRRSAVVMLTLCALALAACGTPGQSGAPKNCYSADPGLRIGGCTANIDSGRLQGKGLAVAYHNRGVAYDELGEYRRAIEDLDQALRLDPGDAAAYGNRGYAYKSLGDYQRAAGDWEQAIRVGGMAAAAWWQEFLKGKGHYAGAIDGGFGADERRALMACAVDPACINPWG